MKSLYAIFIFSILFCCSSSDETQPMSEQEPQVEYYIVGRWHPEGFENNTLYEFTENLRYTIYSSDGTFGTIEDAIPNPNSWTFEGEELVIDLNFDNYLRAVPHFRCDGNVVDLVNSDVTTTLFKEGFDYATCNE